MTQFYKKNEDGEFIEADLSQEDINDAVKARVDRINRKYSDYDELKSQIEAKDKLLRENEDKINGLLSDKANLEDEVKVAKLETEKTKIISEFKLKDDMAEFITGDTVEEMRGRAEKLAHNMQITPSVDIKKEDKPEPKSSDLAKLADNLFGAPEK